MKESLEKNKNSAKKLIEEYCNFYAEKYFYENFFERK
jgi:hypothetical protein